MHQPGTVDVGARNDAVYAQFMGVNELAAAQHYGIVLQSVGRNADGNEISVDRAGVFFFSSRRRHTRFDCDWSSDVCSSDLTRDDLKRVAVIIVLFVFAAIFWSAFEQAPTSLTLFAQDFTDRVIFGFEVPQIGRASCRERV